MAKKKSTKNMETRPITIQEYHQIIELILNGFTYDDNKTFRPNEQLALIFQLQASLGLRVGDILDLELKNFKNGKLEIIEEKTDKVQYRDINPAVTDKIKDYVINNRDSRAYTNNQEDKTNKIFKINIRTVQKQLKIVIDYLGLDHVSTHSFRKFYAMQVYEKNNSDVELVKSLLNHSSISITERYLKLDKDKINNASKEINFIV